VKVCDNDRYQLTDTTNQLNLFNHPRRNIESSCPHTHFKKSRSTTKLIQASSFYFIFPLQQHGFGFLRSKTVAQDCNFFWSHNIVIYPLIVFTIVLAGYYDSMFLKTSKNLSVSMNGYSLLSLEHLTKCQNFIQVYL